MTVDLAVALPTLVAACTLVALLVGGFMKVRKWIEGVASASRATQQQLETSDDRTIAAHVQDSARAIDRINGHIEELTRSAQENRDRSIRAEALAESAHERLDKHLVNEHGVHLTPSQSEEI